MMSFDNKFKKYHHLKKCKARIIPSSNSSASHITHAVTVPTSVPPSLLSTIPQHISNTEQNANTINNTQNNNTQNNNITNNNNITVNNFGSEDKRHVPREMMYQWLLQMNGVGMFNYFKHLNFNMDVPQNHNILDHPNNKMLSVLSDGEWIAADAEVTVDTALKKCRADLISCSSDPEFRKLVNVQEDVLNILQNHLNFGSDSTPNHYYKIMRMFNAELFNFMHRKAIVGNVDS